MENLERIKELEKLIPYYAEKYYNGEVEISDEEFDSLTEELEKLKPDSEILKKVGWGSEEYGKKYDHKYQLIGSLTKTRKWEGIPDKFKTDIILSQKLDGSSAVVQFENGKLVRALTRGNGHQGLDITSKLKRILGKDYINDSEFTGEVRGELIISQENWEELKTRRPDLKNSRNAVAGIINRREIDEDLIGYVDYVVYKVTGSENKNFKDLKEIRQWLSQNFEHTVTSYSLDSNVMNNKDIWNFNSKEFYEKIYPNDGYQIDGLVLSLNEIQKQENGAIIYDEFAYKFESTKAETIVTGIDWNLTRNQRLVPTVTFEPTEIDETLVSRAAGNNALNIKRLEIGVGSKIEFMKANEIIPFITKVIEPRNMKLPEVCPVCREKLEWKGVDLICANPNCKNLEIKDLVIWTDILGKVDDLAWITKEKYLKEEGIETIEDLHKFLDDPTNYLPSKFQSITDIKILEMYTKLKMTSFSLAEALCALNIQRLGWVTACKIQENKEAYETIMNLANEKAGGIDTTELIKVTGPATADSIFENSKKLKRLKLIKIKPFEVKEEIQQVGTFCVTGKLERMKRNDLVALAESKGWKFIGTVNKDCQYLVTNTPDSGSSKNKKAQELGTKLVTENEFFKMIGE